MNIAIIGNGISGVTAARTLRKLDPNCIITLISSETKYFYSRTALMYVYMGHMKFEHTKPYEDSFWEKNRIDLIQDYVTHVDVQQKKLNLKSGKDFIFDALLIATGSKTNKIQWPGIDLKGIQGLYSYQDLQLLEENTHPYNLSSKDQRVKNAVIIGGGLIGVELAEMLISRNIKVTFLVREDRFWGNILPFEEAKMIEKHLISHGVVIKHETEVKEFIGDENGRVKAVETNTGENIPCEFVGIATGVKPNVDFLNDSSLEIGRGILVDEFLKTNIEGIYAAGDCAEFREKLEGRGNIEQVWYTGRMMGEIVARNILGGQEKYSPGPWFNSAKFFDIEYHTYGLVDNETQQGQSTFYWENEEGHACIRVVMDSGSGKLIGVNVFGIRIRHEMMDELLRNESNADQFFQKWKEILFDPEFYKDHGPEIIEKYNKDFNKDIKIKSTSWLSKIL